MLLSGSKLNGFRLIVAITMGLLVASIINAANLMPAIGGDVRSPFWIGIFSFSGVLLLFTTSLLGLSWLPQGKQAISILAHTRKDFGRFKWVNIFAAFLSAGLFFYAVLSWLEITSYSNAIRLTLFWFTALGISGFLSAFQIERPWLVWFTAALLGLGVVYRVFRAFPDISDSIFSLSWSEGSRYYYASLLFSKKIYGFSIPPSVWHPSRYILLSIPFILPEPSLRLLRTWQAFLWLALPAMSAYGLSRRLTTSNRLRQWLFAGWAFLFLLIGPVYYHLHVSLILLYFGFDSKRFGKSLIFVTLASIWAGISRINWVPVPAMIAITIYLVETPIRETPIWRYLAAPFSWGLVGCSAALGAQAFYAYTSGNELAKFGSSFTSDLLWYRLLPNPTFKLGILAGTFIVSLPLLLLLVFLLRRNLQAWHPLRIIGIISMLLLLLVGGLVVSVKIGGGSNLHNIDAFLVLLLTWTSILAFNGFVPENETSYSRHPIPLPIMLLALLLPVFWVGKAQVFLRPQVDQVLEQQALAHIQNKIETSVQPGDEILFINQRHLLLFNYVNNVTLVPDYELIELMEMAMAGNQTYLNRFYDDIGNHRFSLVIADRHTTKIKDPEVAFSEENNIWVQKVSIPFLDNYELSKYYKNLGVAIYVPKSE